MLRVRSRVVGGWLLAVGVVGLALVGACAENKGAIMLAINTDMKAPKDVNAVSVTIANGTAIKHSFIGRVTPQGDVLLPATLAIVEPDDKNATIRIRVMAFQNQKPRVLRDVRTTIPSGGRTALLRIPLNFVNDGSAKGPDLPADLLPAPNPGTGTPGGTSGTPGGTSGTPGGTSGTPGGTSGASGGTSGASGGLGGGGVADYDFFGNFQPPCSDILNQTIIDGECKDTFVDSSTLPDFDQNELGDSTDVGSCFDIVRCLANAQHVDQGGDQAGRDAGIDPTPADAGSGTSGGGSGGLCMAGFTFCDGPGCVDLQNDNNHCGACTAKCVSNTCSGGKCPGGFRGGSLPEAVTLDSNACSLQLNGANAARLNLAIVTPDTGECVRPGECYIPIDRGPTGWQDQNGSVQLPKYVCTLLNSKNLRLATSSDLCAAKEEKNPICTPKGGDTQPPLDAGGDASTDGPVLVIPEPFATTVHTLFEGKQIYFAGATRVAEAEPVAGGAKATNINGVTGSQLPWHFGQSGSTVTLTNRSASAFRIQGTMGTAVTVAQGVVDSSTNGATTFFAVDNAAQGGIYSSNGSTDGGGATKLTTLGVNNATSVAAINDVAFVFGDASGNVRLCDVSKAMCGPPSPVGKGRVDVILSNPANPLNGFALLSDGLYTSTIVNQQTGAIAATNIARAPTAGIMDGGVYYPRGLATNGLCVFYSSTNGVEWRTVSADGGAGGGTGGSLSGLTGLPVLGIATGRDPQGGFQIAYLAVYAPLAQGGGIYKTNIPAVCGGKQGGSFADGGATTDSGVPPMADCGPANCPNGCCDYTVGGGGVCLQFPKQSTTKCNHDGASCQDCNVTLSTCAPFGQTGGLCGG